MRASLADWMDEMEAAERGEGWAAWCAARERYVAPHRQWLDTLVRALSACQPRRAIEVAAGDGWLTRLLLQAGVDIEATDPQLNFGVREALLHHAPDLVLACFPPGDVEIDERIFGCPTVEHYVFLGLDPPAAPAGWTATTLDECERQTLGRWDYLLGFTRTSLVQRTRAVYYRRSS
jgi:hypothetical protein